MATTHNRKTDQQRVENIGGDKCENRDKKKIIFLKETTELSAEKKPL